MTARKLARLCTLLMLLAAWPGHSLWTQTRTITVSTVPEFLAALGSDRTIVLLPGRYDLSYDTILSGPHFVYTGWRRNRELWISDLHRLRIEGAGPRKTEVIIRPALGYVMKFHHCTEISIANLRAGHGEEPGACTGGVLAFANCAQIVLSHLELYGSGVEGITLDSTANINVSHCTIEDCTQSILTANSSGKLCFERCTFRRNGRGSLVNLSQTPLTEFLGCAFENNVADGADFFELDAGSHVRIEGGRFWENSSLHLAKWEDNMSLKRVIFTDDNVYEAQRYAYPKSR